MEKRIFGKTGLEVSCLGFGGAEIGFQGASAQSVERLLGSALDGGLNVIDTAECYSGSEELIGKTMSHRRNDYYLFSKCGHKDNYTDDAWDAMSISQSIDRSLKRLKTDHLDLIQLHSCSKQILEQGQVIHALQSAQKAGKVRFIGYSGDGEDALYAIETGVFDTLQTSISIADQQALDLTLPLAKKKNMGIIAKRPLANVAWKEGKSPSNTYAEPYWQRLQKLKYEFLKDNLNESVEIALRFTLWVPGVHTAIVGTANSDRWLQNAKLAAKGPLPDDLFTSIRNRWNSVAGKDWVGQV